MYCETSAYLSSTSECFYRVCDEDSSKCHRFLPGNRLSFTLCEQTARNAHKRRWLSSGPHLCEIVLSERNSYIGIYTQILQDENGLDTGVATGVRGVCSQLCELQAATARETRMVVQHFRQTRVRVHIKTVSSDENVF